MNVNNPIYNGFAKHVNPKESYKALGMTLFIGRCEPNYSTVVHFRVKVLVLLWI